MSNERVRDPGAIDRELEIMLALSNRLHFDIVFTKQLSGAAGVVGIVICCAYAMNVGWGGPRVPGFFFFLWCTVAFLGVWWILETTEEKLLGAASRDSGWDDEPTGPDSGC